MKHARIWTVVLLLGLAALAGCTVARAEDSPPTTVELPDGGSLSVSLDSLATDATLVTQPAFEHADAGALARPAHGCMELGGYPLDVATPVRWICVVPLAEYEALNDAATAEIAALRTLLAERPALSGQAGSLPDLPLGNSAQVFQSQPAYLDFTGGSGVRYLTLNVQDLVPVTNQGLAYRFQGLTDDGVYLVSATLPISHPDLPASLEAVPEDERMELGMMMPADYESRYGPQAQALVEALDPSGFNPALDTLDAVIQSITLTAP